MKNNRGMIRAIAMLVCLVMIGTLLPVMASAELATPKLTSAVADGSGIRVSWKAVSGAKSYRVYRKTGSSGWTALGTASKTSYKDTSAAEKVTYTYTVRAVSGKQMSGYDKTGVSAAWSNATAGNTDTPKPVSAKAETDGIRVKWKKVSGANGYRIFRKTATTGWKALANVGNVDNYLDKTVKNGVKYTYTIRSLVGTKIKSAYDKTGVSATWSNGIAPGNVATPKLVSAVAEGAGIRVTWQAVDGAAAYRIFRKTGKQNWTALVTVGSVSYLDNATNAGEVYYYTVRCEDANGNLISDYNKNGIKGSWTSPTPGNLSTPVLKEATNTTKGVKITWKAVAFASGYRIYRKLTGGNWAPIGESKGTSYTDKTVSSGIPYIYTVRAKDAAGEIASDYDKTGLKITYYATPKLTGASSLSGGIQITWTPSAGAPMFAIYRKTGSSGFTRLGYTTSASYTDRKVTEGTSYTYTVRCVSADKKTDLSDYDHTGITCVFTGKSAISSLNNELNGVRVNWVAVTGASNYQVLRRTGEGGWIELATVAGTTYLDTQAVNNTTHYYRVRAKDAAGNFIGTDDTNGVAKTYYVAPTLTNCVRDSGGLRVSWEAVAGVSYYTVLRKYGVGNWERVGTTSGTSYVDMTPPSGTFCLYTVQCADWSGNALSVYREPGVGETSYMDQPILNAALNNSGSITVSWNSVDKATNYRVYRRTGDRTTWNVVQNNTTALSWVDADVMKGKTYYYTVCVITADGSAELSEFNSTGTAITYYDPPTLTAVANGKNGVDLTWNAVDYVGTYHVYRKTGNNVDWVSVGTSSSTSFTDTGVTSNAHYTYAVRSMVSGADASGLSNSRDIIYYAAPWMNSIANGDGRITVTWSQEAGIATYRVYRSTNGGSTWKALADVNATSYTDTKAKSVGTKYSYAVTCIKDGAEVSARNDAKTITYVAPVLNVKAADASDAKFHKAKVSWDTVIGNTAYDVYRKTNGTGWTKVGTVADSSLTDTTPSEGTYFYYVVAVRNGSTSAASAVAAVTVN